MLCRARSSRSLVSGVPITVLVQANGTWNATPATSLDDATYEVTASVTDPAGNLGSETQSLTIDTILPSVTITGGATETTNDPTPTIHGTTDEQVGRTVTINGVGVAMTTLVQIGGTWNATPVTDLVIGTYSVVAGVLDPAGNAATATQLLTISSVVPDPDPDPNPGGTAGSGFNAVGPIRVFDTRPGQSPAAFRSVAKHVVGGVDELQIRVVDLVGFVPATGVGAVSMNITVTNPAAAGFVTVYPCGARELVSSVNYVAGQTVANGVIAPLSASGTICIFSSSPTDVVGDLNGWFPKGVIFTAIGPKRIFDTRPDQAQALRQVAKTQIPAGASIEVQLTDLAGLVPTVGVSAVSLNVTVTNPAGAGFITVYSCGTRELVSSVNFITGESVANAAIAPVSASGTVCFFSSATTDLVVDINGWLASGAGFNAVSPRRVLDTRAGQSPNAVRQVAKQQVGGASVLEVEIADLPGVVPAGISAASLNVTATGANAEGFVTIYPCGDRPEASNINYTAGHTTANAVITPLSASGTICVYAQTPVDIVIDINGWF